MRIQGIAKSVFDYFIFVCAMLSTIAIVLIMLANVLDAVLRWLDIPIYGVFELNGLMVGIMIYLGLAYTQKQKRHISVNLVGSILSARTKAITAIIPSILGIVFFVWLTYLYGLRAHDSFVTSEVIPGFVHIPVFPLKASMVLGVATLTIQLLIDVVTDIKTLMSTFIKGESGQ